MMQKLINRILFFGGSADRQLVLRSLSYFQQDAPAIIALVALMSLSTVIGILQAWPLAILVDTLVQSTAQHDWIYRLFLSWAPEKPLVQIAALALTALGLRLVQEALGVAKKLLHSRINYNGVLRLRCDFFRKLQALHLAFHRSQPLGDSVYRLTTDTSGCQVVLGVLVSVGFAVITMVIILAILLSRSVALTLAALLVVPPLLWVNIHFGRKLKKKTMEAKEADSDFLSAAHQSMAAVGLTQTFCRRQDELERFGAAAKRCVGTWLGVNKEEVGYALGLGAILGAGGALILGYGGYMVYRQVLTPGELMVFMSYLGMMYDPLCQLTGAGMNLQSGLVGARRVFEVLDEETLVAEPPDAVRLPLRPRTLKLENVRFHYAAGTPVLDGVTVAVPPGSSVGFVGASGAGKSTLLNLLPRFFLRHEGRPGIRERGRIVLRFSRPALFRHGAADPRPPARPLGRPRGRGLGRAPGGEPPLRPRDRERRSSRRDHRRDLPREKLIAHRTVEIARAHTAAGENPPPGRASRQQNPFVRIGPS